MMKNTLLIRADGYPGIGIGHIMRCLALAQAWQDQGGDAIFACSRLSPKLRTRLKSEGIICAKISASPGSGFDALQTGELAMIKSADWVVVDGYHFGGEYQHILRESGWGILFVDDNRHADHYFADVILNQNLHASNALYADREPYTRLLLGTDYVLLRREFRSRGRSIRATPRIATKVLVTMGGNDPNNMTADVVSLIQKTNCDHLRVKVVVGASYLNYRELIKLVSKSDIPMQIVVNPTNMPELMEWADLAISAGGTTCWEMAYLGLPAILLIIADNQKASAEELHSKGAFVAMNGSQPLENSLFLETLQELIHDKEHREALSNNALQLVDGHGVTRVLNHIVEFEAMEAI